MVFIVESPCSSEMVVQAYPMGQAGNSGAKEWIKNTQFMFKALGS